MLRWLRSKFQRKAIEQLVVPGQYSGWARSPEGEWEDLIGVIKVEWQSFEGRSPITIESIEFGSWRGALGRNELSFRAETGQGDNFFLCSITTQAEAHRVRTVLAGAVWASPSEQIFDIKLLGAWRPTASESHEIR